LGVNAYVTTCMKAESEYLHPLRYPFRTHTPIWVMVGSAEVLHDRVVSIVENMRRIEGHTVELYEIRNEPHDILLMGLFLGWPREADVAARAAYGFLRRQEKRHLVDI
jgi:acetyl esterase/lipase